MNSNQKVLKLPGLIDIHVHLREPGQTHKEDFATGTTAALAGGFTMVLDMPNNLLPVTSKRSLDTKISAARSKIACDLGFYFGSLGDNIDEFKKVYKLATGLKLYLNNTTGGYTIDVKKMKQIYTAWRRLTKTKPILLHAEDDVMPEVTEVLSKVKHPTHICHVSSEKELSAIIRAKKKGLPITCGVCPHHLFLNRNDEKKLGAFGLMKPSLKTKRDLQFLWKNLEFIDVFESDHAPHTKQEKRSKTPPFGVPGLETTLPLLLTAMDQKKITLQQIIERCYTNPLRIFHLPEQKNTYVEVVRKLNIVRGSKLFTKCRWSPFEGWKLHYRVRTVTLRGRLVYRTTSKRVTRTGRIIS